MHGLKADSILTKDGKINIENSKKIIFILSVRLIIITS